MLDKLDAAKIPYTVFSNIQSNPTIENVQDGVEAYKKSGADCMVSVGGGSAMDTGKAIGIIVNNPEFADVRSLEGFSPTKNKTVFTIAVPTTAGTAAEVTINYVITDVEKKRKFVCVDVNDIPEIAVVDPEMMCTMPKGGRGGDQDGDHDDGEAQEVAHLGPERAARVRRRQAEHGPDAAGEGAHEAL